MLVINGVVGAVCYKDSSWETLNEAYLIALQVLYLNEVMGCEPFQAYLMSFSLLTLPL